MFIKPFDISLERGGVVNNNLNHKNIGTIFQFQNICLTLGK